MKLSALAALLFVPVISLAEPVPPNLFHLADEGHEVTVWAQSPLFYNPTNMDIDQYGRIWVAEGVNYRKHFDRRPEGDRIMVLEDSDGDGSADKSWVFVQEKFLRSPMGVAVIGNKVVVSTAPDLVVYTDNDGDAVFDASKGDTREVLLTGFNGRNHDHSLHSITVGPDGKWYFSVGNCGAYFTDNDGKTWRIGAGSQTSSWWPKDPSIADREPSTFGGQESDDGKIYIGGFIARMNPDGTNVEILAHNLRNSYENCVTLAGAVFASDNDDQPACRTFGILEGANYGFASRDGSRSWQVDRRPGQDIRTASWRQDDPGVAPAGDVYGGGAPTGIVFYEHGALGDQWNGTLLLCEPARNTIFGYKPQRDGEGWKLERFDFLTTNKEGKIIGTDYTGGDRTAQADDTKTLFRPSDIAVGPDGAVYIADWYDARVGGHNDLDETLAGTIYRVAPKGFKSVVPKIDLSIEEGIATALKSPAVHVRALARKEKPTPVRKKVWTQEDLVKQADSLNVSDRAAVEKWGMSCEGNESGIYDGLVAGSDPLKWSDRQAMIAWRLHPPQSVAAFRVRALHGELSEKARKDALTAIAYNVTKEAAEAMLEIAEKTDGAIGSTALWWLLNKKDNAWNRHGLESLLKSKGIYDPDKITLTSIALPERQEATFALADAMKLSGDAKRGKIQSARCIMCHRIGDQGVHYGPDLSAWGKTQPTETILRAIVEPSADIAHGFYGHEIETSDGLRIQGVIVNDGDPVIIQSTGGVTQTVPKARIKQKKGLKESLMMTPAQLGLTAQDAADITAYLRTL